jgi:hypothetical protein
MHARGKTTREERAPHRVPAGMSITTAKWWRNNYSPTAEPTWVAMFLGPRPGWKHW